MDPITAIGLVASSLQLAGFVFSAALRCIRLVKDLKDVPSRLRVRLADAENSIHRLSDLQSSLSDPNSKLHRFLDKGQILRLETVVREGQDATEALHQELQSLLPQQPATSSRDRVKAAWKSVVSLGMEKEVEDAIRRIQPLNEEISRELQVMNLESQVDLLEYIDSVHRMEHEVTRGELQSLRDAVLPVITGQSHPISVTNQAVAVRLSDTDKSDLARQLCEALISHPSALKQSCDNAMSLPEKHRRVSGLSKWSPSEIIGVSFKRRLSSTRRLFTGVGLKYELKADHHLGCPLARYAPQSWSYILSLTFLPLVSKTVAFTFGTNRQGGGWSISPGVKFFATVPRSKSPMFRIFDETNRSMPWPPRKIDHSRLVTESRAIFVKIQRVLLDMMASSTGSLTDKDEFGNTLLHEIAGRICEHEIIKGNIR